MKGLAIPQPMIATLDDVEYPDSGGQPMAETDFQRDVMTCAIETLKVRFRGREDVYVAGNLFIYYEEGNRAAAVAPDVFVVFGVPKHLRRTYLLWREGRAPGFVMEVTSEESTRQDDQGRKRDIYARLGMSEYWQYDPTGDYLEPSLQGELYTLVLNLFLRLHQNQKSAIAPYEAHHQPTQL